MELKKYLNKAEMRNLKNLTLLQNDAGPFFDLQRNPLASLVHLLSKKQSELGMQVHCTGGQREGWHCPVLG